MIKHPHPADALAQTRAEIAALQEKERNLEAWLRGHPDSRQGRARVRAPSFTRRSAVFACGLAISTKQPQIGN